MNRLFLLCIVAAGALAAAVQAAPAAAYRYQVLHSFCPASGCGDGALPVGGLVMDGAGNLYGTTSTSHTNGGAVFELTPPNSTHPLWRETVLYGFCSQPLCSDGGGPLAGVRRDQEGNLYGTTVQGGIGTPPRGTVFELTRNPPPGTGWSLNPLYSFCSQANCADGSGPQYGDLLRDRAGNLYGATAKGGNAGNDGVVFQMTPSTINGWKEAVLYAFCPLGDSCLDGASPNAGLIFDGSRNLYGTTQAGGSGGAGVVFKITPQGAESVLYNFCSRANCADGAAPFAGLLMDDSGNLYGTTSGGGADSQGVVYELMPGSGAKWKERVLHSFCTEAGCPDGSVPYGRLIMDRARNLYGTTLGGGSAANGGVVFELTPSAAAPTGFKEEVLHIFCLKAKCVDGAKPSSGLLKDPSGNLYGTASEGGLNGWGVVFGLLKSSM